MLLRVAHGAQDMYTCGNIGLNFNGVFPYLVSIAVLLIKIVIPILLVIFGMIDLGKAVVAQKEEEIKKGQQTLIKRIITAVLVFFIVQVVQIIVNFVSAGEDSSDISKCFNCFISGKEDEETACKPSNA